MGTRHLVAVQMDGEYKIAQYGQWDGYPAGQGAVVLEFLRTANLEAFRDKLRRTHFATASEIEDAWVKAGAPRSAEFVSMEIADKLEKQHPELSRNTGAEVLELVLTSQHPEKLLLDNRIEFAKDSLFCEYAYVIDLDASAIEFYIGFNENEVKEGRFAGPKESGHKKNYGPVRLAGTWPLDELPMVEDLEALCKRDEEDDEEAAA